MFEHRWVEIKWFDIEIKEDKKLRRVHYPLRVRADDKPRYLYDDVRKSTSQCTLWTWCWVALHLSNWMLNLDLIHTHRHMVSSWNETLTYSLWVTLLSESVQISWNAGTGMRQCENMSLQHAVKKIVHPKKWKLCHHLCTLASIQTCISFFPPHNMKSIVMLPFSTQQQWIVTYLYSCLVYEK